MGTDAGYTVQVYGKYNILRSGFVKLLANIGYNYLFSKYPGPGDDFGVRVQSFSIGMGLDLTPLPKSRFKPSVFGLLRYNLVGGESYHHAGLDFFKATSRFGYSAGLKFSYGINKKLGIFAGWSYNYDNLWNKQANPEVISDVHTIPLRDKASFDNGLTHDRRIVYASYIFGISFYLK